MGKLLVPPQNGNAYCLSAKGSDTLHRSFSMEDPTPSIAGELYGFMNLCVGPT